jgi:hypothetical protein
MCSRPNATTEVSAEASCPRRDVSRDGWIAPFGGAMLRRREAIHIKYHLRVTPRSGERGPCFRSFALLADGSSDACELCYGRRHRDNHELTVGVPEKWGLGRKARLLRGRRLVFWRCSTHACGATAPAIPKIDACPHRQRGALPPKPLPQLRARARLAGEKRERLAQCLLRVGRRWCA